MLNGFFLNCNFECFIRAVIRRGPGETDSAALTPQSFSGGATRGHLESTRPHQPNQIQLMRTIFMDENSIFLFFFFSSQIMPFESFSYNFFYLGYTSKTKKIKRMLNNEMGSNAQRAR